jgi:hypothetical protein
MISPQHHKYISTHGPWDYKVRKAELPCDLCQLTWKAISSATQLATSISVLDAVIWIAEAAKASVNADSTEMDSGSRIFNRQVD